MTDTARHWVEVSDPIVWDGTQETADRINEFLLYDHATGFECEFDDEHDEALIQHWPYDRDGLVLTFDRLAIGDSITVFGRWPFVIRAAEVTS